MLPIAIAAFSLRTAGGDLWPGSPKALALNESQSGGEGRIGKRHRRQRSRGESNKQIARALKYSESTVKNRLSVIFEKLGVVDRTQAVIRGMQLGLLKLETEP